MKNKLIKLLVLICVGLSFIFIVASCSNIFKETPIDDDKGSSFVSVSSSSDEESGMSNLIKINYTCSKRIRASIYDSAQNEVAQVSFDDFFGFNGAEFIYVSYADEPSVTDATIYMPNNGYKIVFSYENKAGVIVNFKAEISTLDYDGNKDVSVTNITEKTVSGGIILSIDGVKSAINNTSVSSLVSGTVTNHFPDWKLPDIIEMNKGDTQAVEINGSQSAQVAPLLSWSSADESVATVSSGVITAVGYGKTTISATDGNKSSVCEVVVMQNATTVTFSDVNMFIGERKVITPDFNPVTATETDMKYTYDNGNVVKIDKHGVIYAIAAGTVTVTGTTEYGVTNTFVVTVVDSDFIRETGDVNGDG